MKRVESRLGFAALTVLVAATSLCAARNQNRKPRAQVCPDLTGVYHFLNSGDRLGLLQEDNMLKGYINVLQGPDASDSVFSYPITVGTREGNEVQFQTGRIHEKYFRFTGTVERGAGRKPSDSDYLELKGALETIRVNGVTHTKQVERESAIFTSLGKSEQQASGD